MYVCVLALLDRILIEILYQIALSILHYCHRLDDERIINVTSETLSSNLIRWYWRLLKMRRMSIVLSGEHRNVSITRDSFYRGWCALRDIEALTLQIETVRYKRSVERCRIVSRLIPISATLLGKPIEDSIPFHSIRYIDSISRVSSMKKFMSKSFFRIIWTLLHREAKIQEIYLPIR